MPDKKPDDVGRADVRAPQGPTFHPEYPYPAPPMSDKPWSDEVEADEKKPAKEEKD